MLLQTSLSEYVPNKMSFYTHLETECGKQRYILVSQYIELITLKRA